MRDQSEASTVRPDLAGTAAGEWRSPEDCVGALAEADLARRHFEGLSNGEAAEVLGLSETAANNRYVRALGRLRDLPGRVPGFFDQG